ncbi:helix-turn-helix transcriptional regulator [Ensifer sp. ENS09]|uniref:TetR/AcrR family transcriptional regulator n=1 Tax=Ensifer sp. ENS09 TaxID=2769263 RepID=UPI00177B633D|nr:helix-turn-helix domain-containing protein [Ensifer sp. ENS09]MBD9651818.1 helix-turn-helix transcriptional regulator [Ensifer sp. ENS09]
MPQRLKQEVRERLLAAAAAVFAEQGFEKARLADVAERAGTSSSNIYKYVADKEALFYEIVTPALAGQLLRLLRARVRELRSVGIWLEADASGSEHARALLSFWIEQRLVVLILLRGADGTRYAHVRKLMIREMMRLASGYLTDKGGEQALTPLMGFMLERTFTRTLDTIADTLSEYRDAPSIQSAIALFWRYQLAGLQSLLDPDAPGGGRQAFARPDQSSE